MPSKQRQSSTDPTNVWEHAYHHFDYVLPFLYALIAERFEEAEVFEGLKRDAFLYALQDAMNNFDPEQDKYSGEAK